MCRHRSFNWFNLPKNGFEMNAVSMKQIQIFEHSNSKGIQLMLKVVFSKWKLLSEKVFMEIIKKGLFYTQRYWSSFILDNAMFITTFGLL